MYPMKMVTVNAFFKNAVQVENFKTSFMTYHFVRHGVSLYQAQWFELTYNRNW